MIMFLIMLNFLTVSAQYDFWTEPQAVTDSLTDNRNAVIAELCLHGVWGNYIFWERTIDTATTEIYYRNLYTADMPQPHVGEPGVHYRNPRFIMTSFVDDDTLAYFFYESNAPGNFDIYYQILTMDGFTLPALLASSPTDDFQFRCNDGGDLVWQEGDKIKYASLDISWNHPFTISDPVTIDSIDCYSPEVPGTGNYNAPSYIAWMKGSPGNAAIWYSTYGWQTRSWSSPELFREQSNYESLRFEMEPCYGATAGGPVMTWDSIAGGVHTIRLHDMYMGNFSSEFQQVSPFKPVYGSYMIPMDDDNFFGYLTFINSEAGNGDIFVNDWDGWLSEQIEGYNNLSDSPFEETNPGFFNGRCYMYSCDLVLTWESLRNGHWQIFYSTAEMACAGGTPETGMETDLNLLVSPNPASSEIGISYTLSADSQVSILLSTLDGRQVTILDKEYQVKGDHALKINPNKEITGNISEGLILITLQTSRGTVTRKIILIK